MSRYCFVIGLLLILCAGFGCADKAVAPKGITELSTPGDIDNYKIVMSLINEYRSGNNAHLGLTISCKYALQSIQLSINNVIVALIHDPHGLDYTCPGYALHAITAGDSIAYQLSINDTLYAGTIIVPSITTATKSPFTPDQDTRVTWQLGSVPMYQILDTYYTLANHTVLTENSTQFAATVRSYVIPKSCEVDSTITSAEFDLQAVNYHIHNKILILAIDSYNSAITEHK